jgi:hypothetical protein
MRSRSASRFGTTGSSRHLFVIGCRFENGAIVADGVVTLSVDLALWLKLVDFADLPANQDAETVEVERGSRAHRAFVRGLRKAAAYSFDYRTEASS